MFGAMVVFPDHCRKQISTEAFEKLSQTTSTDIDQQEGICRAKKLSKFRRSVHNFAWMDRFVFRERIATGTKSDINLYFDRQTGKEVCLKSPLEPGNPFPNEEKIIAKISHPNIIGYYGAYSGDNGRVLILDYLPNEDLMETLINDGEDKHEESALAFVRDIAAALDYLHNDVKVIHRRQTR
jgi:serine/threonine protein kinase